MSGVRRAVVIGVDKYAHKYKTNDDGSKVEVIKDLQGARRDATEIYNILTRDGNFTIDPQRHFLTDERANADNIRVALNDLFYRADERADIALLYYAGHGKKDYLDYGWLLPHDFDPAAPLAKGLRIQELKQLFLHPKLNIETGILILDCCYSGIAAAPDSRATEGEVEIKSFHDELQLKTDESGRYILASARANEQARETEQTHGMTKEKHVHGLYSFHLIEGLQGAAADDLGYVSLDRLTKYIGDQFKGADAQHKPQIYGFGSGASGIELARRAEVVERELDRRYQEVASYLESRPYQKIGSPSPQALIAAADVLKEIGARGEQKRHEDFFSQIGTLFDVVATQSCGWWLKNSTDILRANKNSRSYRKFHDAISNPKIRDLCDLGKTQQGFVIQVMDVILTGINSGTPAEEIVQTIVKYIRMLDLDTGETPAIASPSSRPAAAG